MAYAREIEKAGSVASGRRAAVDAGRRQTLRNRSAQELLTRSLAGLGVKELYRAQRVLNGIAVQARAADVARLRRLPGVKRVLPIPPEYPTNAKSVPFIGAPAAWENSVGLPSGLQGQGIRIGVIDTGIDYMHGTFGGTGVLADYQQAATDSASWTTAPASGPGAFPTAKVAGGWDFAGDLYNGSNLPSPDANPMDCYGHGSHVAGTAAGLGVTAAGGTYPGPYNSIDPYSTAPRIGPGVAPAAQLFALRVFGCGGSTRITGSAIDWAVDPNGDGDLSDHLDVINMSLGSSFGHPTDLSATAADNAARAGVIVVASAGNSYDTYFITGSPGAASRAISVANSTDGYASPKLHINAPESLVGDYPAGTASFGRLVNGDTGDLVLVADADGRTIGCTAPFANAIDVAGKIALIDRGTCSFDVKAKNAQDAGAIAVVIANNAAGDPPAMGVGTPAIANAVTIPVLSITQALGVSIKAALPSAAVNVTFSPGGDTVSASSSRGPRNAVPLRLKPDVAAPGTNIPSAQTGRVCDLSATTGCIVGDASGYLAGNQALNISGTSMAAPHIAGVMALLRERNPGWTVSDLKALLMNYSLHDLFQYPVAGSAQYGPGRVGAGRTDVPLSAKGQVVAYDGDDPGLVTVNFDGEIPVGATSVREKTVRLVNRSAVERTFDLGISTTVDAAGVAFSLPSSTITVPAASSATFTVQMTADPSAMDRSRDATVAAQLPGTTLAASPSPRRGATSPSPREGSWSFGSRSTPSYARPPT